MIGKSLVQKAREYLDRRRRAYLTTFSGPVADEVLRDLAQFCRAHETTFHADARASALLEGRREVWLRIAQHLNLDADRLWHLYGKVDNDN